MSEKPIPAGQPIPGFVYLVRVADDSAVYRAMCLRPRVNEPTGMRLVSAWYIYDHPTGPVLSPDRYVAIVGTDGPHMERLLSSLGTVCRAVADAATQPHPAVAAADAAMSRAVLEKVGHEATSPERGTRDILPRCWCGKPINHPPAPGRALQCESCDGATP